MYDRKIGSVGDFSGRKLNYNQVRKQVKVALLGLGLGTTCTVGIQTATAEKGFAKPIIQSINKGQVINDKVETKVYKGAQLVDYVSPSSFDGDLRKLPAVIEWRPGDAVKVANPRRIGDDINRLPAVNKVTKSEAKLIERQKRASHKTKADLQVGVNVTGFDFNGVNPPDPTGEVGETYYIHSINAGGGSSVQVFNKTTGEKVGNAFDMDSLTSAGDCQQGAGDPIIIYDEYAKRWLLSEFTSEGPNKLCIYISKTSDPVTGGWHAYEFAAPSFPDYPKFSVWGGNYFVSANEGSGAVYALDRAKMLAGEAAAMVRKPVPALAGFQFQSITPIDADGLNPPGDGTPGLFIRHRDDELHNSGSNNGEKDFLELWTFTPDFANADNSKLEGPINIEINEFDSNFTCPDGFGCLTQKPEDGQTLSTLDPLKEVVNFKPQYRNFNSHESITGSFVTKLADNNAGLRWFELRKANGSWALHQEGIMPSTDNNSRYMSGAAMDGDGNMALAYMITGPDQFPSIKLTGRRMGDAAGTVSADEITLHEADGAIATERDGDYSHMSVDPIDNCTFWFTAEHGGQGAQWKTKVSSFKFPGCTGTGSTDPGFSMSADNRSQAVCRAGQLQPMAVTVTGFNEFKGEVNLTYAELVNEISGEFSANPVAAGASSNATVTIAEGITAGDYTFKIQGASDGVESREVSASVKVVDKEHTSTLTTPENGAEKVDYTTTLSWTDSGYVSAHTIEIATDESFSNIIATGSVATGTSYRPSQALPQSTKLYWRVKAANICGETMSEVFSFTTSSDKDKAEQLTPNVAKAIEGAEGDYGDYYVEVPGGVDKVTIKTSGGDGDVDLYVGFNKIPTTADDLICRSEEEGNDETCEITDVQEGAYFITTGAYAAFSGAELIAEYVIPNTAPVANSDSFTVQQDSSANIFDVIANDTDADDGDTLTLGAINYGGSGQASISDGKVSYTPAAGFHGTESFTYTVKDSRDGTAQGSVTITVEQKPDSGGGSAGLTGLLLLPILAASRRRQSKK
ncbi:MAG: Ig-like domain-containing protein [Kangiellaceae bacterium]|nr:Ig-like domain-containing protein [Kangiellaceae bacterium]